MGRAPCCDKANVKKGPWSPEEDSKLKEYIEKYGTGGNWIAFPQKAGLKRCGKSCRLRWLNYLRPNIKHGEFSDEEDRIICTLFANIGSRWSIIAAQLPGRTDNDIKNYWNTKLKKKLMGIHPPAHERKLPPFASSPGIPPFQSQPLSSSLYEECSSYYSQTTKSFSGLEAISFPSNYLSSSTSLATNPSIFQTHESWVGSTPYYPVTENVLTFGSEGSRSSDDGSSTQISYGRDNIKQEGMAFQSYISTGLEENPNSMLNYDSNRGENLKQWAEKANAYFDFGEIPLHYALDDVKQLIRSSNSGSNSFVQY